MSVEYSVRGLSTRQRYCKRGFDLVVSLVALLGTLWLIIIAWLVATVDTGENGLFSQARVGKDGKIFRVYKIRTMRTISGATTVTVLNDPRITRFGRIFRKTKIDELPQLINVLLGQMSFVGPRPDVPGYADKLTGNDRIILTVRPGITGPATLQYRNEEQLLAKQDDPRRYNDEVLYPEKVRINREYIENYSFMKDMRYILLTIFG